MEIKNVLRRFLPAWYLPRGTIYATENELDNASSSCERWSIWCGALVIVSVVAELIIALIKTPYGLFMKESVFTDAGTGVGIVGEVLFGMMDSRIQTELRKRSNANLAEANERAGIANEESGRANERAAILEKEAAELRLELKRVKEPLTERQLSPEQISTLEGQLRGSGAHIVVMALSSDREIHAYSEQFVTIFKNSGVAGGHFKGGTITANQVSAIPNGLNIMGPKDEARSCLEAALTDAGIIFGSEELTMLPGMQILPGQLMLLVGPRANLVG